MDHLSNAIFDALRHLQSAIREAGYPSAEIAIVVSSEDLPPSLREDAAVREVIWKNLHPRTATARPIGVVRGVTVFARAPETS